MGQGAAIRALAVRLNIHDLARPGAIVFGGLMVANFFHYLYYMLVSRVVDVAEYGVVTSLLAAALLLAGPSTVGGAAIAKLAADLHAAGEDRQLRRLADLVDIAGLAVGIVAFAATLAFAGPIKAFFHLGSPVTVLLAAGTVAFLLLLPAQRALLQGRQRFAAFAASCVIEGIGKAVLGPFAAIHFGAAGALGGLLAALFLAAGFNAVATRRGTPTHGAAVAVRLRDFGSLAGKTVVALLSINVLLFYDTVLVRHYFSAETAGLYGAANLVGRAIYVALGFLPIILLPKAAERLARGTAARPLLLAGVSVVAGGGAVAIGLCAAVPSVIVRFIAGPSYVGAGPLVFPYAIAAVALAGANAVANFKIGLHRFDHALPLVCIALGEFIVVVLHHNRVEDVLVTVVIGNILAFAATLMGIGQATKTSNAVAN